MAWGGQSARQMKLCLLHDFVFLFCARYSTFKKLNEQVSRKDEVAAGQTRLPFGAGVRQYADSDPKQKAKVRSIAMNLVVDCDLPMHAVERPGFRRYLVEEDPRIAPISSMYS